MKITLARENCIYHIHLNGTDYIRTRYMQSSNFSDGKVFSCGYGNTIQWFKGSQEIKSGTELYNELEKEFNNIKK